MYPDVESITKPIPRGPELPVPNPPTDIDDILSQTSSDGNMPSSGDIFEAEYSSNIPQALHSINSVRDFGLLKDASELLGSRLKENHLLDMDITFLSYQ
ncbi:hypothetical protein PR048_011622 [Dryococelus australis]|uniref:Uncharacterized protein n=1 Tax=Dryococelus australis TaxID=614101 RepID=A0ABQ9HM98_9NEOP|nr:hypothetical protein PR048_011622 [Dryococelus australis]